MAKAAAAVAANQHKQKHGGKKQDEEEDLDPAQYFANRCSSLKALTTSSGLNTYPHKFHVTQSIPLYVEKYCSIADGSKLEENSSLAGRIMAKRGQGKLFFYEVSCCYVVALHLLVRFTILLLTRSCDTIDL